MSRCFSNFFVIFLRPVNGFGGYSTGLLSKHHCHCEERSDVAIRSPKCYVFLKAIVQRDYLGIRIATPACALVRNDIEIWKQS